MNDMRTLENRNEPAAAPAGAAGTPARPCADCTDGVDVQPRVVLARVAGVLENAVLVEVRDERHAARRAASCLLSPEPGDVVMCSASRLGVHILHVLERDAPDCATLSAPGVRRVVLDLPALDIHTEHLDVTATRARARVEHLHLFSRLVSVVTGGFELVADRLKRIARHESASTVDSVRTVRNTDTLRAGHILHDASEVMSLRSHVTVVEARGDVRVNGERISMG